MQKVNKRTPVKTRTKQNDKKDLCFHKSLVYHKGFVAERRNSEAGEFTR